MVVESQEKTKIQNRGKSWAPTLRPLLLASTVMSADLERYISDNALRVSNVAVWGDILTEIICSYSASQTGVSSTM